MRSKNLIAKKTSVYSKREKELLVQQGLHKTLQGKTAKPVGTSDEDWEEMDLKAASTIQLYLTDEVIYNMIVEEKAKRLWSRLEMYMMKSLSNKLYLKKQLYRLRMKEGTAVLEHLKFFNKIISEFLTVDVKIDEEDEALILLSSLPELYDHIVTTTLYGKKTLILEENTSTLLSNEIRKRPNQEERTGSGLVVTGREGRGEEKKGLGSLKTCHFCHRKGY